LTPQYDFADEPYAPKSAFKIATEGGVRERLLGAKVLLRKAFEVFGCRCS
jgi:hypothetical protein